MPFWQQEGKVLKRRDRKWQERWRISPLLYRTFLLYQQWCGLHDFKFEINSIKAIKILSPPIIPFTMRFQSTLSLSCTILQCSYLRNWNHHCLLCILAITQHLFFFFFFLSSALGQCWMTEVSASHLNQNGILDPFLKTAGMPLHFCIYYVLLL